MYKEAQKTGFYELLGARDWYRDFTAEEGGMHADLLKYYVRVQTLLITPITPHFAEHIWTNVLGECDTIQRARFPTPSREIERGVIDAAEYVKETVRKIRTTELALGKRKAKAKGGAGPGSQLTFDATKPKALRIFVSKEFPKWQSQCVEILARHFDKSTGVIDEKAMRAELEKEGLFKEKKTSEQITNLLSNIKLTLKCRGSAIHYDYEDSNPRIRCLCLGTGSQL